MVLNLTKSSTATRISHVSKGSATEFVPDEQAVSSVKSSENILRFVGNIGKKMRSEVNAMIGFSQITDNPDNQQESAPQMVEKLGRSLIDFIDAVKTYWQIETESYPISPKMFRLNSLLNAIKADIKLQTDLDTSCLQITGDRDLPEFLLTDPNCLRQSLITLINDSLVRNELETIQLHVSPCRVNLKEYLRFKLRGVSLPSDIARNGDPFQWKWNEFDASTDMTWLASVLAVKKIRLLGGSVRLTAQSGLQGVLTIDLPRQLPESTAEANRYSPDQILKQVTKNYSAAHRQHKPDLQNREETNYSNSEIYLG